MGLRMAASDQEAQQQLAQGQGYYSNITCTPPDVGKPVAQCFADGFYVINNPGINQKIATNQGLQAGQTATQNASQLNSLVDNLFAQLATQALTSLTGLSGLSQNTNGNSSYLNQLAGNTTTAAISQQESALQNTIESAMGIEASYEAVIQGNITNLTGTQTAEQLAQSCYLTLATSTTAILSGATALGNANFASSTVATVLAPQLAAQNTLLTSSENALVQLNNLDNLVQSAQTKNDISSVQTAYQALVSSGALHTTDDIAAATTDQTSSTATLNALTTVASASLTSCKAGQ